MTHAEIPADELMYRIRQDVAQKVIENLLPAAIQPEPVGHLDRSALTLQPIFQPFSSDAYHANDLLKYHGEEFVRNAYRVILKRDPDPAGMAAQVESLASGRFNKIDVLAALRRSEEGRRVGVVIRGLTWPATVRRFERIPIMGYVLELVIAALRLPVLLRHQRQYEFYALSRDEHIADYVNALQHKVDGNAAEAAVQMTSLETELGAHRQAFESTHAEVSSMLDGLRREAAETNGALHDLELRTTGLAGQFADTTADIHGRLNDHTVRHVELQNELKTLAYDKARLVDSLASYERQLSDLFELTHIQSGLNDDGLDELYVAFEDQFRGDYEEIKQRLQVYLPIFESANVKSDILDVGCGRGEWLELLRDAGMQARGVDHNRIFIEQCKLRELDVVHRDAIAYLRDLPDASLNAITSFHLVEHLPFKILLILLTEMVRVLRTGSPLILETPNPENLMVGSHTFYTDPSHRNPIPSATLRFLLESHGLTRIEVMKVRPWNEARVAGDDELTRRFNEYFYASPDYGIVGWKN